jgi:hypothetical protein
MSAGENSTNIQQMQQHANEEVNQQNLENFFVEEEAAPIIVQGEQQALNINNFQLLGEGVQNLMLAYQDLEDEDLIEPVANENQDQEMEDVHSQGNVSDPNLEAFQFNDIVPPEVAHLQIARVETFFFQNKIFRSFLRRVWSYGRNTLPHIFSHLLMLLGKRY